MRALRLSRRTLLRGAGSVAIALPWLEAMSPLKESLAAAAPAQRFVAVFTPGGTVLDAFKPSPGPALALTSPILAPLSQHRERLIVLQGLGMKCAANDARERGLLAWLTGASFDSANGDALNPSLDVALAARFGGTPLYQAVRWGTGATSATQPEHGTVASYRLASGTLMPVAPSLDPVATWRSLFGAESVDGSPDFRRSVLDSVLTRYHNLSQRLGSADRMRLEAHVDTLRALEMRVGATCQRPLQPTLGRYDPSAGREPSPTTDAAIPEISSVMIDLMVVALACDIKRVATLQWADASASYTLPWLDLSSDETHAAYGGEGGTYRPEDLTKIFNWYSTMHAHLLDRLASVDMGGRSLLDESVVFFGSNVQSTATYSVDDMPFLLAGGGGGLRGNRLLSFGDRPHNDLLAAISYLFDAPTERYGDAAFNTSPLEELT